jgi:hypothetical protein
MTNIAIIGPQGSGKTLLAENLVQYQGFTRIGIADPIKKMVDETYHSLPKNETIKIHKYSGDHVLTGREVLQGIGAALREFDNDFWLRQFRSRYAIAERAGHSIVCDDMRLAREVFYVKQFDPAVVVVCLMASPEERARRLGSPLIAPNDVTELGWMNAAYDFMVNTSHYAPDEVFAEVMGYIHSIEGGKI